VLITCWSSKGGSGTTVVAAALATVLAAEAGEALLVDLGGDLPAALGLPESPVGLTGWRPVTGEGPAGAGLRSLAVDVAPGVRLVPRGPGSLDARIAPGLAAALTLGGPVVVDAGVVEPDSVGLELAAAASASLLVLRPCFLGLRRAVAAPFRASGVVLVDEPQRVLGASDLEAALGIPVVAVLPWDPAVARRVDAGLLGSAVPRSLSRPLRRLVAPHARAEGARPAPPPDGWPEAAA
jgi:hypothetical protein